MVKICDVHISLTRFLDIQRFALQELWIRRLSMLFLEISFRWVQFLLLKTIDHKAASVQLLGPQSFTFHCFAETEIIKKLKSMDDTMNPGPDGVPIGLLKKNVLDPWQNRYAGCFSVHSLVESLQIFESYHLYFLFLKQ